MKAYQCTARCPPMARSGSQDHASGTSALTPGTDLLGGAAEGPLVTRSGQGSNAGLSARPVRWRLYRQRRHAYSFELLHGPYVARLRIRLGHRRRRAYWLTSDWETVVHASPDLNRSGKIKTNSFSGCRLLALHTRHLWVGDDEPWSVDVCR